MSVVTVAVVAMLSACLGFLAAAVMAAAKRREDDFHNGTHPPRALPGPSRN
jgi:hypothetical protein